MNMATIANKLFNDFWIDNTTFGNSENDYLMRK